jgi:acyl carrier protein
MSMRSISIDDVAGIIRAQLGNKLPDGVVLRPETGLEDLGLSSLDVTEAFVAIEELVGCELDSLPVSDANAIGDLVAVVNAQLADGVAATELAC